MENIKKIVSISTIIACTHINGGVCGDSCKINDANAIEFENYTKLEGDQRKKVLEFIIGEKDYGVNEKKTIENDCVVFKNGTSIKNTTLFIFLFNETIYKAQTDDRLKNSIKQLDNKQLYFIVGFQTIDEMNIHGSFKEGIIPNNQLTITKVDGNDNKYKLEIAGITKPLGASSKPPMGGSGMPDIHTSTTTSTSTSSIFK